MITDPTGTIKQILDFEKNFSCQQYQGNGKENFIIEKGVIPIMLSAPHSINQQRDGKKKRADKMTGSIAQFLHKATGCHIIYSAKFSEGDANYDPIANNGNPYQSRLIEYIKENNIKVLIDLHGAAAERGFAIEIGTAPLRDASNNIIGNEFRSLKGHDFIVKLIKYTLDYFLRDVQHPKKEVWHNRVFDAGHQNTVTKSVSEHTDCACLQMEINRAYRETENTAEFIKLLESLIYIISTLSNIDWTANKIDVYRLWQSNKHKPQDKIEFHFSDTFTTTFKEHSLLYICSLQKGSEIVRLHKANSNLMQNFRTAQQPEEKIQEQEYVFLTNRLIEFLFGRDWIAPNETLSSLRGAPIVIYENNKDRYRIGYPKANNIDNIAFSSMLYQCKESDADKFDFMIFNRYTDSRVHIDFSAADYRDYGRVKDKNGQPAKKIMLPRYYRRLLGYLDFPLKTMRSEEYMHLIRMTGNEAEDFLAQAYRKQDGHYILQDEPFGNHRIQELFKSLSFDTGIFTVQLTETEMENLGNRLKEKLTMPLKQCYRKMSDEVLYACKESEEHAKSREEATEIQRYFGLYDYVEILTAPKDNTSKIPLRKKIRRVFNSGITWIMKRVIGKLECSLRTTWTSETDDRNNVARLSRNMMSLIGVSENDKIVIKYGNRKETLRVLEDKEMKNFQVGVPAPTRKKLGMSSTNDAVVVYRDMLHTFKRHSLEQMFAIIGMTITITQMTDDPLWAILMCVTLIPIIIYFILNEERIKVK